VSPYIFTALLLLIGSVAHNNETFIEKISLGKCSYDIYSMKNWPEDSTTAFEYFLVYAENDSLALGGGFKYVIRKDGNQKLAEGNYQIKGRYIIFKTRYFNGYNGQASDSVFKYYRSKECGALRLSKIVNYRRGKGHIQRLPFK
jgi:hypothetical protein